MTPRLLFSSAKLIESAGASETNAIYTQTFAYALFRSPTAACASTHSSHPLTHS